MYYKECKEYVRESYALPFKYNFEVIRKDISFKFHFPSPIVEATSTVLDVSVEELSSKDIFRTLLFLSTDIEEMISLRSYLAAETKVAEDFLVKALELQKSLPNTLVVLGWDRISNVPKITITATK